MKSNKYLLGTGVSYNPKNVRRVETSKKFSIKELFGNYGSPEYNRDMERMSNIHGFLNMKATGK